MKGMGGVMKFCSDCDYDKSKVGESLCTVCTVIVTELHTREGIKCPYGFVLKF